MPTVLTANEDATFWKSLGSTASWHFCNLERPSSILDAVLPSRLPGTSSKKAAM